MEKEKCGNCKYYSSGDSVGFRECRRHSPIVENLITTDIYMTNRKIVFPQTKSFCWCGDWELDLNGNANVVDILDTLIADSNLALSERILNVFNYHGIDSIRNLVAHTACELLAFKNFGKTSLAEVEWELNKFLKGLMLKQQ